MYNFQKAQGSRKSASSRSREIKVIRDRLIVPDFQGSARFTNGHVRSFYVNIEQYFSFKMIPKKKTNFVIIVLHNGKRLALWPGHPYFDVYKGETLEPNAKVEFWALGGKDITVQSFVLPISRLNYPPRLCSDPDYMSYYLYPVYSYYKPYGQCNPLCQPLEII